MITEPIDCVNQGKDPYDAHACNPLNSVYNYPPVWLDLRFLGVTSRSAALLGGMQIILFLVALLSLFAAQRWISALVIFFGVLSKPVLFVVERGNNDLVIFSALILGLLACSRVSAGRRNLWQSSLIIGLTVLQIYPVAAVIFFVRGRRSWLTSLAVSVLAGVALVATTGRNLVKVVANTPHAVGASYGAFPVLMTFGVHAYPRWLPVLESHRVVASVLGLALFSISVLAGTRRKADLQRWLPPLDFSSGRGSIAVACTAIFCFTFVMGSFWDYRLVFLLGILAFFVDDLNRRRDLRSLPICLLILAFMWAPLFTMTVLIQALDVIVFVVCSAWLGSGLLDHLRTRSKPAF